MRNPNIKLMKRFPYLTAFLLCLLVMASCGDSGSDDPTPDAATFRVDIQQTGEHEKFIKAISLSGGEFYRTGTQEEMPTILYDEDLTGPSYSYEAEGVRELNILTTVGFSPVDEAPANMGLKISVYRNGQLLDATTYTYTEESDSVQDNLTYKAND